MAPLILFNPRQRMGRDVRIELEIFKALMATFHLLAGTLKRGAAIGRFLQTGRGQHDMTVLETERLTVRQWTMDDVDRLRPIATDPRVLRHIGGGQPWSEERIRGFVEGGIDVARTRGWVLWPLVFKGDGNFIGFAGFNSAFAPEVEIGWWLSPDYWGQGLATEAGRALLDYGFATFKFPRVISVAQPGNVASINVMKKLGMSFDRRFVHEGIKVVSYAKQNPRSTACV
jgi:[ribosomal protein S5]-alanine N-acetyltransferase